MKINNSQKKRKKLEKEIANFEQEINSIRVILSFYPCNGKNLSLKKSKECKKCDSFVFCYNERLNLTKLTYELLCLEENVKKCKKIEEKYSKKKICMNFIVNGNER